MNKGQLVIGILIYLWLMAAAALVAFTVADSGGSNPVTAAGVVAFFTLLLLTPIAIGVGIWKWFGNRERPLRTYAQVSVTPIAVALVGGVLALAFVPERQGGSSRSQECHWAWSHHPEARIRLSRLQLNPAQYGYSVAVKASAENISHATFQLQSYGVQFLSGEGNPVGEYFVDTRYPQPLLRPGYFEDLSILIRTTDMPSIASRDTARVGVRFCERR